ncbi:MAG: conjugal transfer protein TraG [Burkholderiaceae bacterium]|nr:MAG: conjugal transfer protein TraG [Burkholderiaceae bacterium]
MVPSFTSSVISTANIGQWDYYIFSDNVAIWRALNGLAAWFNGSGALLQNAAWLGALIVLAIALYGAAVGKSAVSGGTLGAWFFFMSCMGLTGQANVYNIYTNQVTVVNNVPALALVPASAFSKAGYKVFTTMETAFSGVTGSYMAVTQHGFMGPLEILLSLRSPKFGTIRPGLSQSLTEVVHQCAVNPAIGAAPPISEATDALNWLKVYGRKTGLTRVFPENDPTGAGVIKTCEDAILFINDEYGIVATGNIDLMKLINGDTNRRNPQDPNGLWQDSNLSSSYNMLIASAVGMTQNAIQFTKNALTASTITYTMDCMTQSGAMTTPDTCQSGALALANSMEKWKTDAAMAGSGFLKTMFTSMGVLQALFFSLFPIIAIYGLVVPTKTAKVFGGFVFFGIWCQSWLLAVAPIQSYVQTSIVEEMGKIMAGAGGMTIANSMAVYQALSTKLAVAGDIMASAQMLSLALLSGSMIALSGLAKKWSAEKQMDSSKLQMDVAKSSAMTENRPLNTVSTIVGPNGQATSAISRVGEGNFNLQTTITQGTAASRSSEVTAGHEQSRVKTAQLQKLLADQYGITQEQYATVSNAKSAINTVQGTVGTQMFGALGSALSSILPKGHKMSQAQQDAAVQKVQSQAIQQLAAKDAGFIDRLMGKAGKDAQIDAAADVVEYGMMGLTAVAVGAETMTGVGGLAAPATAAGGAILSTAARKATISTLRSKLTDTAKDITKDAAAMAGAQAISDSVRGGGRGRLESVANALSGGLGATYQAAIQSAHKSETGAGAKKSKTRTQTFSGSEVDKLDEAWKAAETEKASLTHSGGQSQTMSISLDELGVMGLAVRGFGTEGTEGYVSGEELMRRTRENEMVLRSTGDKARIAAADRDVAMGTAGKSAATYGGGSRGQALFDFQKGLIFQKSMRGQITSSNLNAPSGALVGGEVLTTKNKEGVLSVAPTQSAAGVKKPGQLKGDDLGADVGRGNDARQVEAFVDNGGRANATAAAAAPPPSATLAGMNPPEAGAFVSAVGENENQIMYIAGASAITEAVNSGLEAYRTRPTSGPGTPSGGGSTPSGGNGGARQGSTPPSSGTPPASGTGPQPANGGTPTPQSQPSSQRQQIPANQRARVPAVNRLPRGPRRP